MSDEEKIKKIKLQVFKTLAENKLNSTESYNALERSLTAMVAFEKASLSMELGGSK